MTKDQNMTNDNPLSNYCTTLIFSEKISLTLPSGMPNLLQNQTTYFELPSRSADRGECKERSYFAIKYSSTASLFSKASRISSRRSSVTPPYQ